MEKELCSVDNSGLGAGFFYIPYHLVFLLPPLPFLLPSSSSHSSPLSSSFPSPTSTVSSGNLLSSTSPVHIASAPAPTPVPSPPPTPPPPPSVSLNPNQSVAFVEVPCYYTCFSTLQIIPAIPPKRSYAPNTPYSVNAGERY